MLAFQLSRRLYRPLFLVPTDSFCSSFSSSCYMPLLNSISSPVSGASIAAASSSSGTCLPSNLDLFRSPWFAIQCRGVKVSGSDVRVGNVIEKQGHIYEVLKVDHSHEGRGKATIKVELRDIGQGNKVTQRLGTDEGVEKVYIHEQTFIYMCMDHDGTVVLLNPDTLDQLEVSRDLFGKNALYLQDEMKVKVQFYDDKPLSASVPQRVTCIVKEDIAAAATTRYRKVVLENGLTVEVPPHIVAGDAIILNTEEDTYLERAKA